MTVEAVTMYRARCDAPGCTKLSCDYVDGNNAVYDTLAELNKQFQDNREGTLADEHGWLRVPGSSLPTGSDPDAVSTDKHYCGDHTVWDEDCDKRLPNPSGQLAKPAVPGAPPADTTDPAKVS